MIRRLLIMTCLTAGLAGAVLSAPRAAKLVFLHNGRVFRVQEVRLSDGWYKLTLGKRSTINIPAALIDEVIEIDDDLRGSTLPNVQTSAGGRTGGVPVNRAATPSVPRPVRAVARPAGAAVTPPQGGTPPQLAQDARARAEALAARGRTLGVDLTGRRRVAGAARSPDEKARPPMGVDLTGGATAWPSLLENGVSSRPRGNSRREPQGDDHR